MLGLPTLKNSLKHLFKSCNHKQKASVAIALSDLYQWEGEKDYLFPFFHQSDMRFSQSKFELETHALAWWLLKSKIIERSVYMIYIDTPSMAMDNKSISNIEQWDIENVFIKTDNSSQGSDGSIELKKDLTLLELCLFEHELPKNLKTITLNKGMKIPIEIGTNDICKMYQYLVPNYLNHKSICRLPYDFGKGNRMAIFYSA